ncbi:MAG: peptidylprolyl isomerase, partial [Ruminococcus sp.]
GAVSMARAEDYNSATCQFFICLSDLTYLDGSYAAFGNVTEGMETIDNFLNVPRSAGRMGEISSPDTPIYIKYAGVVEADTAGNPRIQFIIDIDENAVKNTTVSETTTSVTSTVTTSPEEETETDTESSPESSSDAVSETEIAAETESTAETESSSETETTSPDAVG